MNKIFDVAIIGGGMSGIILALSLKEKGIDVCILEAKDRIGKKILQTGNGKCNILNSNLDVSNYNNSFPKYALDKYNINALKEFYKSLGLLLKEDNEGRIYPYSESANSVLNIFLERIEKLNIPVFLNTKIEKIYKEDGLYSIYSKSDIYSSKIVVLATGSNATSGINSHSIYGAFGHKITKLEQSLVSIKTNALKGCSGVRSKAKASLYINNECVFEENGELLFKDNYLSGILAFKMSAFIARALVKNDTIDSYIEIDFVPEYTKDEIEKFLDQSSLSNPLNGILHKAIALNFKDSNNLAYDIKHYKCKVEGLYPIDNAQVVSGGLDVSQFDDKTMESKLSQNLYALGEVLDVDGQCGGYNLSFACASALVAKDSIINKLCK